MSTQLSLSLVLGVFLLLAATRSQAQIPDSPGEVCALMSGQSVAAPLTALDADGNDFDLTAALAQQPSLIIFFRGGW